MNEGLLIILPGVLVMICVVVICCYLYFEQRCKLKQFKPDTFLYWNLTDNELIHITEGYTQGSLVRELGDRFDLAKRGIRDD